MRRLAPPLVLALLLACPPRAGAVAIGYWDTPRAGTNFFNQVEKAERFRAAAAAGIRLVRLVPDKWKGEGRDFLLGDADDHRGIPPGDLARLREVLGFAQAARVRVVLGMLSLPGCRWSQHNGDVSDYRLYREPHYQAQAIAFWGALARELRGHPAIAAYNLLNEPHPERAEDTRGFDLNAMYARMVTAVRAADPDTPIVLDGGDYASIDGFERLRPLADDKLLYAFHHYEPWSYIDHRSKGRHAYPGMIDGERWDRAAMRRRLDRVASWQQRHGIPASRIFAAEFGVPRTHPGAATWLADNIALYEERGWHWAFYSYREDTWDAMDYELGTKKLPWKYWRAKERGLEPALVRGDNPLWAELRAGLARRGGEAE